MDRSQNLAALETVLDAGMQAPGAQGVEQLRRAAYLHTIIEAMLSEQVAWLPDTETIFMTRTPASVSDHVLHVVKTGGFGLALALALLLFNRGQTMPCSERRQQPLACIADGFDVRSLFRRFV